MFVNRVLFAAVLSMAATTIHAQALMKPAPAANPAAPVAPGAPGAAAAKPSPFDEMDTNHDGFVSREEYLAAQKKRFDEFDTNHDGKIDAKEIANSPPLMERNLNTAEHMVKQWDANGDGIVTAEEFKKFAEDRFAKQDKDGTGKIARPTPPGQVQMQPPGSKQQTTLKVLPAPPPTPQPPQH